MTSPVVSGPSPTSGGPAPSQPTLDQMATAWIDAQTPPAPHPARVHPRRPDQPRTGLTTRQIDILTLAANGTTNRAIARALGVGVEAINSQMLLIRRKLRVGDRTQAVAVALRLGVLAMEDITIPDGANDGHRDAV